MRDPLRRIEDWRVLRVQLLIEIKRTARMIDTALCELGEAGMLAEDERRALAYLDRSTCSPCISDVSRGLRISRQAAHRLVARLRRRGYVKVVHTGYVRLVQLCITDAGSEALRMASSRVIGLLFTASGGMDDRTLEATAAALRTLQARLQRLRHGGALPIQGRRSSNQ
jgi:DNA-binding MarR family transcriptional regulator